MRALRVPCTLSRHSSFAQPNGSSRPPRSAIASLTIRQGHGHRRRLAVDLADPGVLGAHDRLQVLAHVADLGRGHRHEAPVVRPGIIEDLDDRLQLLIEAAHLDRTKADAGALAQPLEHAPGARRRRRGDIEGVGDQVARLPVALLLDPRAVVARHVAHHQIRRRLEAVDQEAGLVVDREENGPVARRMPRALSHASAASNRAAKTSGSSSAFEEAEMAGGVGVALEMQPIDLGADPPDRALAAECQPVGDLGMLEIGVLLGVEVLQALEHQRLHPISDRPRRAAPASGETA